MKTQKAGNVRGKGNQKGVWNNRSDTVVLNAEPFRIWDTLKLFHPHRSEILTMVIILNRIGAKRTVIAAVLNLQERDSFCGVRKWTTDDVKEILEGYWV